jgi:hypothetical protein
VSLWEEETWFDARMESGLCDCELPEVVQDERKDKVREVVSVARRQTLSRPSLFDLPGGFEPSLSLDRFFRPVV